MKVSVKLKFVKRFNLQIFANKALNDRKTKVFVNSSTHQGKGLRISTHILSQVAHDVNLMTLAEE